MCSAWRNSSVIRISPASAAEQRRLAVFTVSPMTVNSSRRSEPMLPANASPKFRPMPICSSGRPAARQLRVQLVELVHHLDRRGHRLVGVVGAADRRAPLRHDRVADELVERAVMPEHAVHHLGEVLGEQARHVVRTHRLRRARVKPRMSLNSTATGRLSPPSRIASDDSAMRLASCGVKKRSKLLRASISRWMRCANCPFSIATAAMPANAMQNSKSSSLKRCVAVTLST